MAGETQIRVIGYKERKEMTDVQKITEILLKELDWEQDLLFGFVGCEERKVACITEKHLEDMVTALVRGGIGDTDAIAAHWIQYSNALEHRAEVAERAFDNTMKVFHEMLSTIFPDTKIDLDEWKKNNLANAEKELAEGEE